MNCRVNIAAVVSGDIGISYCQEVSTAGSLQEMVGDLDEKINDMGIVYNDVL